MKITITINDLTGECPRGEIVKKIKKKLYKVLKNERSSGELNIIFVDNKYIKRLNRCYRKVNRATDVLSFSMMENGVIGDVAISKEEALKNAKISGVKPDQELLRLALHGALHLLGYNHKEMRDKERKYLKCGVC